MSTGLCDNMYLWILGTERIRTSDVGLGGMTETLLTKANDKGLFFATRTCMHGRGSPLDLIICPRTCVRSTILRAGAARVAWDRSMSGRSNNAHKTIN
jgi:hypothetical protein